MLPPLPLAGSTTPSIAPTSYLAIDRPIYDNVLEEAGIPGRLSVAGAYRVFSSGVNSTTTPTTSSLGGFFFFGTCHL